MNGVDTTLVFGFRDEMAFLSARSRASEIDLGETLRDAFDRIGSAGGHADMAGAQLEIGILGDVDDADEVESIVSVVEEVITNRFSRRSRRVPASPSVPTRRRASGCSLEPAIPKTASQRSRRRHRSSPQLGDSAFAHGPLTIHVWTSCRKGENPRSKST